MTTWSTPTDFPRAVEQEELPAYLRLTLAPGIGNITARKLLAAYDLPQTIFEQSISALRQVVSKKASRCSACGAA